MSKTDTLKLMLIIMCALIVVMEIVFIVIIKKMRKIMNGEGGTYDWLREELLGQWVELNPQNANCPALLEFEEKNMEYTDFLGKSDKAKWKLEDDQAVPKIINVTPDFDPEFTMTQHLESINDKQFSILTAVIKSENGELETFEFARKKNIREIPAGYKSEIAKEVNLQ